MILPTRSPSYRGRPCSGQAEQDRDDAAERPDALRGVGGVRDDDDRLDGVQGETFGGDHVVERDAGGARVAVGEPMKESDVERSGQRASVLPTSAPAAM